MKYSIHGLVLLLWVGHAAALSLDEAEQMLKAGQAEAVYARLAPLEFRQAGQVDFDYLLGVAALESGQAARATLAFERVLAVSPQHAAARLDIGRAYFALGDYAQAKEAFTASRRLNPPQAALTTIERYLAAIEERSASRQASRASAYIEAGFGRDSNVSVGPLQSTVYLPSFAAQFTLDPLSRQLRDDYRQIALGGEVTHALNERLTAFAAADINLRDYRRYDNYDYASADWRAGMQLKEGEDSYRLTLGYNDYRLESDAYRRTHTLGADWRRKLGPQGSLLGFAQYARLRYVNDLLNSNDANQWLLGAGWMWQTSGDEAATLALSGYFGQELESRERLDGSKDIAGARLGLQKALSGDFDVYTIASVQRGRYGRENVLFEQLRRDTQYDVSLGAVWRFSSNWSLRPQATWTHNDSSLTINDYKRYDLGVFVRRDFR